MKFDLFSTLKVAYQEAREQDDRHAMDETATAISYVASGQRELATDIARRLGLIELKV